MISMAATFIPCCQFDECLSETASASREEKKEQKGTCSPFSNCPTCSASIVITKTIQLCRLEVSNKQLFEIDPACILSSHSSSFWQPPRLS
jgi:hypothetical protein